MKNSQSRPRLKTLANQSSWKICCSCTREQAQDEDFKEPNKIKELTGWAKVTFVVGNYSEFWGYKKFPKQSLFRTITVENLEQNFNGLIFIPWFPAISKLKNHPSDQYWVSIGDVKLEG